MKNTQNDLPLLGAIPSFPHSRTSVLVLVAIVPLLLLSGGSTTFAGSATWKAAPATGDWNTASNWMPATVPNSAGSTATFATSNTTGLSLSGATQVNGTVFQSGASAFTITTNSFTFTLSGAGITNSSAKSQNLVAGVDETGGRGTFIFANSATAGSATVFTANGPALSGALGGLVQFDNTSTADHATLVNKGRYCHWCGWRRHSIQRLIFRRQ